MKFESCRSKGTLVIVRKRRMDGRTDGRTGQKQYVSPRGGGDIMIGNEVKM
jgi:hypothetical protein